MWQLAIFALASATSAEKDRITFENEAFGARHTLVCTWFSNFEHSRFDQCHDATGKLLQDGDGASLKCLKDTCKQLDAAARQAAGWRKPEPPAGTFTVRLVGRVSLHPRQKRYLGDTTRTILIEKLLRVRVSK